MKNFILATLLSAGLIGVVYAAGFAGNQMGSPKTTGIPVKSLQNIRLADEIAGIDNTAIALSDSLVIK